MLQPIGSVHTLRVPETSVLVNSIRAHKEIARSKEGNCVRNRELVNNYSTLLDIRALNVKDCRKGINIQSSLNIWRSEQYKFIVLSKHWNIGNGLRIIKRGREVQLASISSNSLKEFLASSIIRRNTRKMMLVKAPRIVVLGKQLEHNTILVIVIAAHRNSHNLRDKRIQTILVSECSTKLVIVDSNCVLVAPVLRVIPALRFWPMQLEQSFGFIIVAMRTNPLRRNFLNSATVVYLCTLKRRENVIPCLTTNIRKSNTINKHVHELIKVSLIHGVKKCLDSRTNLALCGIWNALLIIVICVQVNRSENGTIIGCHNLLPS